MPQQSGVAERYNPALAEMGRSISYLQPRNSPFELGKPRKTNHLRIFGCEHIL